MDARAAKQAKKKDTQHQQNTDSGGVDNTTATAIFAVVIEQQDNMKTLVSNLKESVDSMKYDLIQTKENYRMELTALQAQVTLLEQQARTARIRPPRQKQQASQSHQHYPHYHQQNWDY